jgi:predicted branched-subunit amino acid permease
MGIDIAWQTAVWILVLLSTACAGMSLGAELQARKDEKELFAAYRRLDEAFALLYAKQQPSRSVKQSSKAGQ